MENIIQINILTPLISFFIFVFLIALMIYSYKKTNIYELILLIFLTSIIIGVISITMNILPFSPYIQAFFMLFQAIIFLRASIHTNFKKNDD